MAALLSASAFVGDAAALRSAPAGSASSGRVAFAVVAKESRIGKASVKVPKGVTVTVSPDNSVTAKARGGRQLAGSAGSSAKSALGVLGLARWRGRRQRRSRTGLVALARAGAEGRAVVHV